jgi:ZIP family zinc transporter
VTGVLSGVPPVLQTLVATTFTWGVTALGAALVFGARQVERRLLDAMLASPPGTSKQVGSCRRMGTMYG